MIKIINISERGPYHGMNEYELYINDTLIVKFNHFRRWDGLSQCLRDAADAIDAMPTRKDELLNKIVKMIDETDGYDNIGKNDE